MLFLLIVILATAATSLGDDFSDGNHQFSAALYKELIVDNDDNVLVSPFALETLVAIAQSGAVGDTGDEIRKSLYLPGSQAATEKALQSLISEIEVNAPTFLLSNTVAVDSKFSINADFKAAASDVYHAKTSSGSSGVSLSTDLVFRANFATAFKLQLEKQDFLGSKQLVKSETMFLKAGTYNYAQSKALDAQILEIPFDIDTVSLTIVLPNKESGIGVLEKNMESVLATPDFAEATVDVTLPTFRIATKTDFAGILQNLGVKKAFDSKNADFSGIAGNAGDLYLKQINQMMNLNFSPTGLNADIATEESLPISSAAADVVFTADHPFIFYVKVRDVVVLVGRVLDP